MEPIPEEGKKHEQHLQELAEKSWNLELIISGAAIFLVSYLPGLIDKMLWYYLDNLAADGDLRKSALPLLAYSFFKMVAWILVGTFLIHFSLRAFWVGLVGLHAVYPKGIQYDKLPMQSEFSREVSERNFGSFADYIMRLDRLSNQVFSLAFLVALGGLGISLLYLILFVLLHPSLLPAWMGGPQERMLVLALFDVLLGLLPLIIQLLARRPGSLENPALRRTAAFILRYLPAVMLPLVYRPLGYINLIYSSNISRRRLAFSMTAIMLVLIGGVFYVLLQTQMQLRGRNITVRQEFFARNNTPYTLYPNQYDNLRADNDFLPGVSVQSDVVDGPVVKVFVSYRKWLDQHLLQHCTMPDWPDSISRNRLRTLQDSSRLDCLSAFFHLTVNDSVYTNPDWQFYTHPQYGSYGLLGYIPTNSFAAGKNIISVQIPKTAGTDSLSLYGKVPVWYFPSH